MRRYGAGLAAAASLARPVFRSSGRVIAAGPASMCATQIATPGAAPSVSGLQTSSIPSTVACHRQARFASSAAAQTEAELVQVLTTKPRHVARRVRQMMVGTNRRIAQFRNTVTFLMIVIQTKLQSKELTPEDAAIVIEGVMRECVTLNQSDMAHLLFRAALRFKKFGVKLTVDCIRLLYDSYRGNDNKDLMRQLGSEMKDSNEHRALALAAFVYGHEDAEAAALRLRLKPGEMTTDDYVALVEAYAGTSQFKGLDAVLDEVVPLEGKIDLGRVLSAATCASKSSPEVQEMCFRTALENFVPVTDNAVAAICRARLEKVKTPEAAFAVEDELKRVLKVEQLGVGATTAIVARASMVLTRSFDKGDDVMGLKVEHLRSVIEAQIANDEMVDIEPTNITAILKGYGILAQTDQMMKFFRSLQKRAPTLVDHLMYVEVMKWQMYAGNVRVVLDLKREMEVAGLYHHPRVYTILFRALDRYYPRLTEQYYREMRGRLAHLDPGLYAAVVRTFVDLRRMDIVEEVYNEMKTRAEQGHRVYNEGSLLALLRAFKNNRSVFDSILQVANRDQFLNHPQIQGRVIDGYGTQKRFRELDTFVRALPSKTTPVYIALLYVYTDKRDLASFTTIIDEMCENQVEITDMMYQAVAVCCAKWRDTSAVRDILTRVRGMVGVKTDRYYATAAITCHRLGDHDGVAKLWTELRESGQPISMDTFNQFLGLHVQRHNVTLMQDVLRTMMERVPPNPVTTTTVVDMLGKMGRLSEMELLIDEMSKSAEVQPTIVTHHHAMHAYARHGDVVKMEAMRGRLRRDGFKENNFTFNILFDGYGRAKRYEHLADLVTERLGLGIAMDDTGYAVLLNMYAKGRMADEVNRTVAAILERSAARVIESASIDGHETIRSETGLSARMTASIAEAYSYIHDLSNVEKYVQMTLTHPHCTSTHVETVFLIYHRLRDLSKLDMMLTKYGGSEFVYNVCVAAFAKMQHHDRVGELLEVMKARDYALHTNTAIILSSLLLKAGKVELAQAVLRWRTRESTQLERDGAASDDSSGAGRKRKKKAAEPDVVGSQAAEALEEETVAATGGASA